MDMIIRFWDNSTNMVSAKYYNSKFLGMAVAVGVHSKLQSSTKSLDASKMIQVFLDFFLFFCDLVRFHSPVGVEFKGKVLFGFYMK